MFVINKNFFFKSTKLNDEQLEKINKQETFSKFNVELDSFIGKSKLYKNHYSVSEGDKKSIASLVFINEISDYKICVVDKCYQNFDFDNFIEEIIEKD